MPALRRNERTEKGLQMQAPLLPRLELTSQMRSTLPMKDTKRRPMGGAGSGVSPQEMGEEPRRLLAGNVGYRTRLASGMRGRGRFRGGDLRFAMGSVGR